MGWGQQDDNSILLVASCLTWTWHQLPSQLSPFHLSSTQQKHMTLLLHDLKALFKMLWTTWRQEASCSLWTEWMLQSFWILPWRHVFFEAMDENIYGAVMDAKAAQDGATRTMETQGMTQDTKLTDYFGWQWLSICSLNPTTFLPPITDLLSNPYSLTAHTWGPILRSMCYEGVDCTSL